MVESSLPTMSSSRKKALSMTSSTMMRCDLEKPMSKLTAALWLGENAVESSKSCVEVLQGRCYDVMRCCCIAVQRHGTAQLDECSINAAAHRTLKCMIYYRERR